MGKEPINKGPSVSPRVNIQISQYPPNSYISRNVVSRPEYSLGMREKKDNEPINWELSAHIWSGVNPIKQIFA